MNQAEINKLLDMALAVTGSDYRTAATIQTPRQALSAWRKGKKTMPAGDVALVAEIAGLDPVAWCARAVAEAYEETEKGALLKQALKKALVVTGADLDGNGKAPDDLTRCIDSKVIKLRTFIHLRRGYLTNDRLTCSAYCKTRRPVLRYSLNRTPEVTVWQ